MSTEKIKKPFYKKWWVWVLAIIVVIALTPGGEEETSKNEASKKENDETVATAKEAEEVEEVVIPGIGEVVKVGDVEFTVNGTSTASNVGGQWGSDAVGTFLIADVTVTNVGNEAITADSSFFTLVVGEKKYESDSTATMQADEGLNFFYESINPDLSKTGKVVFDVTDAVISNPELMLQVQTGYFGTETSLIKIAK